MFELKPITAAGVPAALAKAERYRLLNEPREAESICRDILRADEGNQDALVTMLLALTDQFGKDPRVNVNHAREVLPRLSEEYAQFYYDGVICERWAKAQMEHGAPGYVVFDWLKQAMEHFAAAEPMSPSGNDDAILRWNTCARMIRRREELKPLEQDSCIEGGFEDEVPFR